MQEYDENYAKINFKKHPEKYRIGSGEYGVLIVEPYKSELLPHWRYRNEELAQTSASRIYAMFLDYLSRNDFVGADMARKYLRMGFTRAMRYAKYPGGKKYKPDGTHHAQQTWADKEKRKAALIFKSYWDKARTNEKYKHMKDHHRKMHGNS